MPDPKPLSALQMAVMRVFWMHGEATSSQVHDVLRSDRDLAPTTVATVISRLAKQGILDYRRDGRQHIYFPLVTEREVRRSMVGDLVDTLFRGNRTALVSHLVKEGDITADELAMLRRLLDNASVDDEGGTDA
ncbi:MAG: BlaI/MecI/CopY family transcriptional regulator [Rhodothermales bacterium]